MDTNSSGQGPSGAVVEKTIQITAPSRALDALSGKEPEAPKEDNIDQVDDAGVSKSDAPDDPNSPDDKSDVLPEPEETIDNVEGDDDEVNLDDLILEVGGKDVTVSELLNEREEFARRIAEIDKDEFLKGFINHYLTTGSATDYLEAKGVDWDKKDDIDVLRVKFDRENADLDPKIREKLWRRELADKYKIKPDLTEEEMQSEDYEIAQGLLKRDANKVRGEYKETQKKFQVVDRKPEGKTQAPKFDTEAYRKQLIADKQLTGLVKEKLIKLGVKDSAGNSLGYEPTNPDGIIEMMSNDRKFWETFVNGKNIDLAKQAKIYAYAMDTDAFEQSLVDLGKTLGLEERLKEAKNTDGRLDKKTTEAQTKETNWNKGFLQAALKQKRN